MSSQGVAGTATVAKVRARHAVAPVYNLTVRGTSRYLVGACGVVVHNKEGGPTPRLNGRDLWGRPERLQKHFNDHGGDFGSRSAGEYAQQAADFFVDAQRRGLPTKIDGKGVIHVYDPETNTFAAYNPNGTTATFFKPKRGIDYWNDPRRCPGVSPWSPGQ